MLVCIRPLWADAEIHLPSLTASDADTIFALVGRNPSDARFKQVEEQVTWVMRFPSGVTFNGYTGYSAHLVQYYQLMFTKGWAELNPAFPYEGLRMRVGYLAPDGKTEIVEERSLPRKNRFALEMDHMARCVTENRTPHTPGEEGLADMKVIQAIYESARRNRPVTLPAVKTRDASRGPEPDEKEDGS